MKNSEKMEELLVAFASFLEEFESKFIQYFVTLGLAYEKIYEKEDLRIVAKEVYAQMLHSELDISYKEEELFLKMQKEGVMIGFLINRSILFFLENFIHNIQKNNPLFCKYIETMVLNTTYFIRHFETHICDKYKAQILNLNFDSDANTIIGNNILTIFQNLKKTNESVTLFNLYKGVPIKHIATVVEIDGDAVVFQTDAMQEIAMKMDGHAYIMRDAHFNRYIKADIVFSNFYNNTVTLDNFTYLLNMPANQRENVRVHPDIGVTVRLNNEDAEPIKGKLFDLSINGLAVISEQNNGIYMGAQIEISFELLDSMVYAQGEILDIIEYKDAFRFCMKIYPDVNNEAIIVEYVQKREKEIIKNLENLLKEYS
ncbi:MAG: PilZ domain-containing protein [Sulfurospirillum sp.]|nr:PilZ domain-containing protein [Sulfurospirillum sp.]